MVMIMIIKMMIIIVIIKMITMIPDVKMVLVFVALSILELLRLRERQ